MFQKLITLLLLTFIFSSCTKVNDGTKIEIDIQLVVIRSNGSRFKNMDYKVCHYHKAAFGMNLNGKNYEENDNVLLCKDVHANKKGYARITRYFDVTSITKKSQEAIDQVLIIAKADQDEEDILNGHLRNNHMEVQMDTSKVNCTNKEVLKCTGILTAKIK